jgi:PAS domain S-box-containing protein
MATVITQGMDVGWRGDIHLRRRDGEVFAANVTVFSIDDGDGDDRHLVAIIRDVTENRRAEERLLFTQASVDHASEAVFWYDVTGRFSYVNEAACRMLGYARETLVGMNVLNVDVTVRPEEFKPRMDALVADGVLEMESVLRRADGVLIDVAISAIALRWNEGSQLVAHIRDISEQKRAELALRDEKNFSDTLIDSLPGVFYLFDEQARLLRWNSTLARVIGQPERWFAGRAVTELIAPEDRPLIAAKFEEILSQGTASVEARLLTVNGAEEPYHFIGRRIVQGDRVLVVGAGIDIAERKASEERLRIIQYAVDRASVAFEWLDLEGKVIAGNIQAYESLGYTREEFIGLNVRDFTPDLTEARWREHVARLRAKGGELVEGRHRRKDGTVYPIEIRANFVQFGGQEYVFSYINDISARQAAQQALRDSERRLAELFDFLPDATFAIDTQGVVIAWNRAMETMSGVGKEAVLGRSDQAYAQAFYGEGRPMLIDLAIDHPDSPLQARTDLIRREGDTLVMEDRSVQTRGDRRVALWAKAAPLRDAEGRVTGAVEVIRDITERTEREAELQQKTDEMTRFTYTVSHDLKSPLVTIRTFLGFLEEDIQNQDADRIAKDLGFIRNAAERMSRLLEELLDLSRLGRVVNNPVDVDYADLVREALDLVAGRVAERGVTISTDAPSLMIHGDHPRLVEVFQNLIDNAVKFMGDQVAPRIDIGVESVEGKWRFHVRDNGMGIDPRYHHKLFDLFEKLDRNVEGSGIGLTLVKRIIELHGGRIWVESAGPGQGSTFFFTLGAVSPPA